MRVFSPASAEDGNRFSFRNVVFLLSRTPNDGKSPKDPVILCDIPDCSNERLCALRVSECGEFANDLIFRTMLQYSLWNIR
jgi:hypothetical protein